MAAGTITVGNVEVAAIADTVLESDPAMFFPAVPPGAWDEFKHRWPAAFSADGSKLCFNIGGFLLRSSGQYVLVDTGFGPAPLGGAAAAPGRLLESLRAAGLEPGAVDIVLHTHLHVDHCGWNVDHAGPEARPTFSNARYVVQRAEWEHFTQPQVLQQSPYIQRQVVPLHDLGRLDLVGGEHTLTSELTLLPSPGHTPGHVSLLINSGGKRALVLGDVAHHPAQLTEQSWCSFIDSDPERALASRAGLLDRLDSDPQLAFAGHFPYPGFGRVLRLAGRRYWQST